MEMPKSDKALEQYFREVRSLLPCSRKQKDGILARFRASVDDYLADYPEADIIQIREHFGAPEDIAAAYVESEGTAEILAALRLRKRVMTVVATVMAIILISWGAVVTWAVYSVKDTNGGELIVIKTEIETIPADHWEQEGLIRAP